MNGNINANSPMSSNGEEENHKNELNDMDQQFNGEDEEAEQAGGISRGIPQEEKMQLENNRNVIKDVVSYLAAVADAYEGETDDDFAELISLEDNHVQLMDILVKKNFRSIVKAYLSLPVSDLIIRHLEVINSALTYNYSAMLVHQSQLIETFGRQFQDQVGDNWGIGVMKVLCQDLRKIASTAHLTEDPMVRAEENTPTCMERAANVILSLFRICAGDSRVEEKESRRWAMLMLANELFKIYFRINRLQLCKPLIRAIESQPLKEKFPLQQMITYKYYVGKKSMFDSDFKAAEENLTFAFDNSPGYPLSQNRRTVLIYLIPVKMFLGRIPLEQAMRHYDLLEFMDVANAVRRGSVKGFDESLRIHEDMFIKHGVYFILEKLRMLLIRNLFKRVALISETNQIPINYFSTALSWSGYEYPCMEEVHCLLSNLIFDGQIRGYISFQHQILVVAKTNAIPKLSWKNIDV